MALSMHSVNSKINTFPKSFSIVFVLPLEMTVSGGKRPSFTDLANACGMELHLKPVGENHRRP